MGASAAVASCRCSVFLLDRHSHELVAKVFDGGVVDDEVRWAAGGKRHDFRGFGEDFRLGEGRASCP